VPPGGRQPAATGTPGHAIGMTVPGPSPQVQAAIGVGKTPTAVLVAEASVWVANSGDGTVSRIDVATNRVIATVRVGGSPSHLTADSGAIWVATADGLRRIDPAINQVIQTVPLPVGLGDVRAIHGHLWVSLNDGTIRRLDPTDGRVLGSISLASGGVPVLASDGSRLWAASGGTLVVISPQRAAVTERFVDKERLLLRGNRVVQLTRLALVGEVAWESSSDGRVFRFKFDSLRKTMRGRVVASLEAPGLVAAGPAGVFVAIPWIKTVTRLDPSTGQVMASIQLAGLYQLAVGADAAWVTAENQGILYRINL
jgi:YVTN family beta-propeller protein